MIGPRFFQFLWFGFLFWIISFSLKSRDFNETADPRFVSLIVFFPFGVFSFVEIQRFQRSCRLSNLE